MAEPGNGRPNGDALRGFLLKEMDRARLCRLPVALGLIRPENPEGLAQVLRSALEELRSFDHAEPLAGNRLAIVLSVTPLCAAERMMAAILRRARQIPQDGGLCSAGLVGYGGYVALTPEALFQSAEHALAQACDHGCGTLEIAPSADVEMAPRETLVCADEKLFLFTGRLSSKK